MWGHGGQFLGRGMRLERFRLFVSPKQWREFQIKSSVAGVESFFSYEIREVPPASN